MTFSTAFDINLLLFGIIHNKRDFKLITHFLIYNMEYSEQFACIFIPGVVITNNHLLISSKVCSIIYFSIFFDIFRYFSIYCNILTCGSNLLISKRKNGFDSKAESVFLLYVGRCKLNIAIRPICMGNILIRDASSTRRTIQSSGHHCGNFAARNVGVWPEGTIRITIDPPS